MSWKVVQITSAKAAQRKDIISFSGEKINFSAGFIHAYNLSHCRYVTYLVDEEHCRIGFKFLVDQAEGNTVKIDWRKRDTPSGRIGIEPLRKHQFIRDVENSPNISDRRFIPELERAGSLGDIFVIRLAPMFENSLPAHQVGNIPSDASGIYRYLKDGETVYIGKGDIRRRAQSAEREHWDYDTLQYSIIKRTNKDLQDAEQFRWEKHWILRFKEQNAGQRPLYNKNDGTGVE